MALITSNRETYDGGTIEVSLNGVTAGGASNLIGGFGGGALNDIASGLLGGSRNLIGIESIEYGFEIETTSCKGSGQFPRSLTPGIMKYKPASMEIWLSELNSWMDAVGGPSGMLTQTFDVTITYRIGSISPLIKVELTDCKVTNVSAAHRTASAENLVSTVEFAVGGIKYNGKGGIIGELIGQAAGIVRNFT